MHVANSQFNSMITHENVNISSNDTFLTRAFPADANLNENENLVMQYIAWWRSVLKYIRIVKLLCRFDNSISLYGHHLTQTAEPNL